MIIRKLKLLNLGCETLFKNIFRPKSKKIEIISSPVDGVLMKLESVNDPVFSQKMMGDGFAILPEATRKSIFAPMDGKIIMLPQSSHAFGIETSTGFELLVHLGLDTVNLNGKGFKSLVKVGQKVKRQQPIIECDFAFLEKKGFDIDVMTIFTKGLEQEINYQKSFGDNINSNDVLAIF